MNRSGRGRQVHALVRDHLELGPFAGHLYLFASRRRDRVKILCWNRDGFAVWSKRLEEGTYPIPAAEPHTRRMEMSPEELGALLSGIDLSTGVRLPRYRGKINILYQSTGIDIGRRRA